MQELLDFGAGAEIAWMRDRLRPAFQDFKYLPRLDPVAQLVRSLLGSRTKDEVSWRVYREMIFLFPRWADLAAASYEIVETVIGDVTFADKKARYIVQTLRIIAIDYPDYNLEFLRAWPTHRAMAWLQRLNGVGPKIAAATLNFSTLCMPAFVVDTHVLRVLRRFGLIGPRADSAKAYITIMSTTKGWSAEELEEFHILLKRLGQTYCRHGLVGCEKCPLSSSCKRINVPEAGNAAVENRAAASTSLCLGDVAG